MTPAEHPDRTTGGEVLAPRHVPPPSFADAHAHAHAVHGRRRRPISLRSGSTEDRPRTMSTGTAPERRLVLRAADRPRNGAGFGVKAPRRDTLVRLPQPCPVPLPVRSTSSSTNVRARPNVRPRAEYRLRGTRVSGRGVGSTQMSLRGSSSMDLLGPAARSPPAVHTLRTDRAREPTVRPARARPQQISRAGAV